VNRSTAPGRTRLGLIGRVGRAAGGAVAVAVLVVGGAAPASAEPQRTISIDPTGDVGGPPTVTGSFKGASLLLNVEKITGVDLTVSPTGPTGGSPVTKNGCDVASSGACNSPQITFEWQIPALAYNGPYVVGATGRYCDPLLCLNPESASAEPVEFRLGAEPSAPTELRTEPGADRSVIVSWARNGEPDMLYYALFRKDPGGEFRRVGGNVTHPASGRPTFTDTSVSGTNGGDFAYKVFAVRNGPSGDADGPTKVSRASAERSVTVAAPPTTTTPGDPNAPTTLPAGQGVDISSFLSGQAPALASPAPIFLDLPDTGFGDTLPFGSLPDEAEPGEEDAVLPETPRQRELAEFKRGRPLIPVAAGLILLVLAGHVRLLNVRIKPAVAPRKLPPGAYVARALAAARPSQIPIDVAAAVADGGHYRAPPLPVPGDDLAGLPVWAEFEPVSALGLLDEPWPGEGDESSGNGNGHNGNGNGHNGNGHNGNGNGHNGNGPEDDEHHQFELYAFHPQAEPPPEPARVSVSEILPEAYLPEAARVPAEPVSKLTPEPAPEPEPEIDPTPDPAWEVFDFDFDLEPEGDPQQLYEFDSEAQWSAAPEVFVSPRS